MQWDTLNTSIEGIRAHYAAGDFTPAELVHHLREKAQTYADHNIWIHLLSAEEISPYLRALETKEIAELPLYGIPFAIKDNIDLANIPTTAACEAFAYTPAQHAYVVARLIHAGAIPLGKTNMDQFATGLVGTRSPAPWGPCKNAFDSAYISGGSSSGSAVAVSLGLASFSLGTDTAGSGRVPAAFNNLVGLKPSKGLLSTQGVVPACRSLDTVSIFTLTCDDASLVFNIAQDYDSADPYSRKNPFSNSPRNAGEAQGEITLGVPYSAQLQFFGNDASERDFFSSLNQWKKLGAKIQEVDFQPFLDAARLLYEGPWVSERTLATQAFTLAHPDAMHPVVKKIIAPGSTNTATEVFQALYQLNALKKAADLALQDVDFIITPTAAIQPTLTQVLANPIELNSTLGYYTNYMNLLDYSAIALPNARHTGPIPNGFTLVANSFFDQKLLAWGATWQRHMQTTLGCTTSEQTTTTKPGFNDLATINIVVCGAHLSAQPLNWQLTERGATLSEVTQSSANYRLYALADGKRPGMIRDENSGCPIDVEVWRMPAENFGTFVNAVPAPLGIGKVELADGRWFSGFICEHYGLDEAVEISQLGGWRQYLRSKLSE